jgi:hypothetical protein
MAGNRSERPDLEVRHVRVARLSLRKIPVVVEIVFTFVCSHI